VVLGEYSSFPRSLERFLKASSKTQIALEYIYQQKGLRHVFWVSGGSFLKFSKAYRRILWKARIPFSDDSDDETLLLKVKRWLESEDSGDWIIVLDNADNEEDFASQGSIMSRFLPQGSKGTILITTRSRQVANWEGCTFIEVGKMAELEARDLLIRRIGSFCAWDEHDKEASKKLLDALDYVPLAIVGVASFMTETGTTPTEYWNISQGKEEQKKRLLFEGFEDFRRETDMTESILSTYFITFDRIKQQLPEAMDLLALIAFFDRQNIPEALLKGSGLPGMDNPIEFHAAIGKLSGFSLVTRSGDKSVYELHRLVQQSIKGYLSSEEARQYKTKSLEVVSQLFPKYTSKSRHLCASYLPHALAVTEGIDDPMASSLHLRTATYLHEAGYHNDAETQIRRCIALQDDGEETDEFCRKLDVFCQILLSQGKYEEAETVGWRALKGRERLSGGEDRGCLGTICNLASVLRYRGKHVEAEAMYRRAFESSEMIYGPNHTNTEACLSNLATMLGTLGKYDEAEKIFRGAVEGKGKKRGTEHHPTLADIQNLAGVLQEMGRYEEAESLHRHALEIGEKSFRPEHPLILNSMSSLGVVLVQRGKYHEAESIHKSVLEASERSLGLYHPTTLYSVVHLAETYMHLGKYPESERLHRLALDHYEKTEGPEHPDTLHSTNRVATILYAQDKFGEAEKMFRRALEGKVKCFGHEHPETLDFMKDLALAQYDLKPNDAGAEKIAPAGVGTPEENAWARTPPNSIFNA